MDHFEKHRQDYLALSENEKVKSQTVQTGRPLINEPTPILSFLPSYGTPQTSNSPVDYNMLWDVWLNSPEAIAPCETIVTDIITDGYTIRPLKATGQEGKQLVAKAEAFLNRNQFKTRVLPSLIRDMLVTGDAYLYKPKLNEVQVRKAIKDKINGLPLFNKKSTENYLYLSLVDEDTYATKDIITIASSTIKIKNDTHGNVLEYMQKVGENKETFTTDEIIHWKYMHLNGKVYSFCPLKALLPELSLIASIKDSAGNKFDWGGVPNFIFGLPEETPESQNVKFLQQQLKEFNDLRNKHRSIVTTGQTDIKTIEDKDMKTMEFRELLEQMTRIVYTMWGVPPSKMGQPGGEGAYDSGLATESYQRRIDYLQDNVYAPLNIQLMMAEFGVEVLPNKAYKQDEEREVQMTKQKYDIAQQGWQNNWLNQEGIIALLNIPDEHQGTFEKNDPMEGMLNQGLRKKEEVGKSTPDKEIKDMKRETQKEKTPEKVKSLHEKGFTTTEIEAILENV